MSSEAMDAANLSFSVDPSGAKTGAASVVKSLDDIRRSSAAAATGFRQQESAFEKMVGATRQGLVLLGAGFAGMRAASLIKQTIELSARYNELGIGLTRVAANVGATKGQIAGLEDSLRKTGISAIQARQSIMSMVQANMDLTQATKLARVAQDAAVVGQVNSSDALQRIIYGLQTAQPEMLRTLGLTVNFEQAYAKMAATLNVGQDALSNEQKAQARLNAVLLAGTKITGLYEASMTSASKQLRSTERYVQDLQVKLGSLFQPAYTAAVFVYADALKYMAKNTDLVVVGITGIVAVLGASKMAGMLTSAAQAIRAFGSSFTETGRQKAAAPLLAAKDQAFLVLKEAKAHVVLAAAVRDSTLAESRGAKTAHEKAQATLSVTAAARSYTAALHAESVAQAQAITLSRTASTALRGLTLATIAQSVASKALAFVGGPVGLALTVMAIAAAKLATATSASVKFTEKHGAELQVYLDRINAADKAVNTLTKSEKARVDAENRASLRAKQVDLGSQKSEMGLTGGTDFLGGTKSAIDAVSLGMSKKGWEAARQLKVLREEFAKTGEVTKYRQGLAAIFEKMGPLTASQEEYRKALAEQPKVYQALSDWIDVLTGKAPALEAVAKKIADAFSMTEVQTTELTKSYKGANDAQAKLTLAKRIGVDAANAHSVAAGKMNMTLTDLEKVLGGTRNATYMAAVAQVDLAKKTGVSEKGFATLTSATKVTKAEISAFNRATQDTITGFTRAATAAEQFSEKVDDLRGAAKKLGQQDTFEKKWLPAMRAAFSSAQTKQVEEFGRVLAAQVTDIDRGTASLVARNAATRAGGDAMALLNAKEEAAAAIREKGLTGITAVIQYQRIYNALLARSKVEKEEAVSSTVKSTREQIRATNEEAAAYEKGGEAVSRLSKKIAFLNLLKQGVSVFNATVLVSQLDEAEKRLAKAKGTADITKEAFLEAARGIQRTFSSTIADTFSGSLNNAKAYGDQLVSLFKGIAAQIASAFLIKKLGIADMLSDIEKKGLSMKDMMGGGMLKGKSMATRGAAGAIVGGAVGYSTGNAALGALSGAASGFAVAGPIGAAAGAVAGLVGGMLGHAKALREEQKRVEEVTRQYKRSMEDFVAAFIQPLTDAQKQTKEIQQWAKSQADLAATGIGKGAKIGGTETELSVSQLQGMAAYAEQQALLLTYIPKLSAKWAAFATQMREAADTVTKAIVKTAAERAKFESAFNSELSARAASISGNEAEADAIRLRLRQQAEMDDATTRGFTATTLAELKRVQALEATASALRKAQELEVERSNFFFDLARRTGELTGNSALSATAEADSRRQSDTRGADDLLRRKVITQAQYDEFLALINQAFTTALADRKQGFADRQADLGVRRLAGAGASGAAEDLAFQLSQQRELRDAMRDTSEEGKLYADTLRQVQVIEAAAREAGKVRIESLRVQAAADAQQDLTVRAMVAQGRSEEAEAYAFQLSQQREMRDALKDTTAEGLRYAVTLGLVQAAETAARAAAKAAAAQAFAQSVEVRLLRAGGKGSDADTMQIQIDRARELAEVTSAEVKLRLELLYALEDENRARAIARANQSDYNAMMVETLQLQGRGAEAAQLEFSYKQELFRDELNQKRVMKTITEATFNLGMQLIGLRKGAFDTQQQSALDGAAGGAAETASREARDPAQINTSSTFSYDANAILTSMLIAERETAMNTSRIAAAFVGGVPRTSGVAPAGAVNVNVTISGATIVGSTAEAVGSQIATNVTQAVNEALGRAASTELRNQGSIV